jgi:DNA-directed RNA polymerase specialized sigma24 family protein
MTSSAFEDWIRYVESLLAAAPGHRLTAAQREALVLRCDGWSYGQIAAQLGISKGSVEARVSGAVKSLEAWAEQQEARRARLLMVPPS